MSVRSYLPSQIPSCSYNAPEYVLASDYRALEAAARKIACKECWYTPDNAPRDLWCESCAPLRAILEKQQ